MNTQDWNVALYDGQHSFVTQYGKALLDLLAPRPGERILDVGCGTGHLTKRIADCGATVIGLDNSPNMIAAARCAHPDVTFVLADARDFTFDEPFDAVFSNATLHWVTPPEAAARCIADALKPGGRFVAEFGGAGNVAHITNAIRNTRYALTGEDHPHGWFFPSIGAYASLLETYGLEVQAAWLFDRPTPLEGEDGLRHWLTMFGGEMLRGLAAEEIAHVTAQAERTLRTTHYRDGQWFADYRRIRIVAVKTGVEF
ncbi:MAG: methyltransferase type 11 [Candidatus Roseilinea sp.]|nr:MAG: methyltransferase type 11 [Candidatus Roseilinea sp.]